jgi:hypothetical protein
VTDASGTITDSKESVAWLARAGMTANKFINKPTETAREAFKIKIISIGSNHMDTSS